MGEASPAFDISQQLYGTEVANVDAKGRVMISTKKRTKIGDVFVLTLGEMSQIVLYPMKSWELVLKLLYSLETEDPARKQFARVILGNADDSASFDSQNRIVIPMALRKGADLIEEQAVVIGMGDRVEIWNAANWKAFNENPNDFKPGRRQAVDGAYELMKSRPQI